MFLKTPFFVTTVSTMSRTKRAKLTMAETVVAELRGKGNATIAAQSQGFFKTGAGEYGEGDVFLGIRVPEIRASVKKYRVDLPTATELLQSPYHEVRFFAIQSLVDLYASNQAQVYDLYVSSPKINNWDLVDTSAPHVVGRHLLRDDERQRTLDDMAASDSLWTRRIAVVATLAFIRQHDFDDTLRLSALLRDDPQDLVRKATGWMLREVAKRDMGPATTFLDEHAALMPRTMLRYAIERFPKDLRTKYMNARREASTPKDTSEEEL
mmetsp:Transcript_25618/g.82966  ORF Transcript_25618/g.82966 Transcript_25618/m.82966 type:complete len:267 (+) Transcript_25618:1459-2259(+)